MNFYISTIISSPQRVYNEFTQLPAPSWLDSSIGKSTAPVSQRSWVRIPFKPEFFSGFLFAAAKVAYITAMILHLFILSSAVQMYEFSYIHFQLYHWFNTGISKISKIKLNLKNPLIK